MGANSARRREHSAGVPACFRRPFDVLGSVSSTCLNSETPGCPWGSSARKVLHGREGLKSLSSELCADGSPCDISSPDRGPVSWVCLLTAPLPGPARCLTGVSNPSPTKLRFPSKLAPPPLRMLISRSCSRRKPGNGLCILLYDLLPTSPTWIISKSDFSICSRI